MVSYTFYLFEDILGEIGRLIIELSCCLKLNLLVTPNVLDYVEFYYFLTLNFSGVDLTYDTSFELILLRFAH
jgi:hypothetical protein